MFVDEIKRKIASNHGVIAQPVRSDPMVGEMKIDGQPLFPPPYLIFDLWN